MLATSLRQLLLIVAIWNPDLEHTVPEQSIPLQFIVESNDNTPISGLQIHAIFNGHDFIAGVSDKYGSVEFGGSANSCYAMRGTEIVARARVIGNTCVLHVGLKTIGAVTSHTSSEIVDDSTAAGIATGSIEQGLTLEPNLRPRSEGGTGKISVNGVPLTLPQFGGSGPPFPTDLLDSAAVATDDNGEAIVDYRLPAPTATPAGRAEFRVANEDYSSLKGVLTGTSGHLGYATVASGRLENGQLAGDVFKDTSGLTYDHSTNMSAFAQATTLTYAAGNLHVNATEINNDSDSLHIDTFSSGLHIYGEGPNLPQTTTSLTDYVRSTYASGRSSYSLLAVHYDGASSFDGTNRFQSGSLSPLYSYSNYTGYYDRAGWTTASEADIYSANLTVNRTAFVSSNGFAGYAGSLTSDLLELKASQKYRSLSVSEEMDASANTGIFSNKALTGILSFSQVGRFADGSLTLASFMPDSTGELGFHSQQFGVPEASVFDCRGTVSLPGPGSLNNQPPRTNSLGIDVNVHSGPVALKGGAFLARTVNDEIAVYAKSTEVDFPADYIAELNSYYIDSCGGPVASPSVYVSRFENHDTDTIEWYVQASQKLARASWKMNYESYAYHATDDIGDPLLSTTIQLPQVPLHRANGIFALLIGKTTAAFAIQYQSANNSLNLPPYIQTYFGVSQPLRNGSVGLSFSNVLNAYNFRVSTTASAIGINTGAGIAPTLASPLTPHWRLIFNEKT